MHIKNIKNIHCTLHLRIPRWISSNSDLHATAEIGRDWQTVEIMAVWTGIQWRNVEQRKQTNKKSCRANKTDHDAYQFTTPITDIKCDVRQQGKCKQKSKHKSDKVGIVVDHR